MPRWVIVGVAGDKRVLAMQAALATSGQPTAVVLPWTSIIDDPDLIPRTLQDGDVFRLESPGSDLETWGAIARVGGLTDAVPAFGHWRPGRAWFQGLTAIGERIESAIQHRSVIQTHSVSEVLAMTDKLRCRERLTVAGVSIPDGFLAKDPGEFRNQLRQREWAQVFVKPRWGSSGAGILAFRRSAYGIEAKEIIHTTVHLRTHVDGLKWLNSKRLHRYTARCDIDLLLARLLKDGAIVERWIPKMSIAEGPLDLRLVVIAGRVRQRICRVGSGTITNLHLDGQRLECAALMEQLPTRTMLAIEDLCLQTAAAFPHSLMMGIDCLLTQAGLPMILEANAWGDYLPRLEHQGQDTYAAQVSAIASNKWAVT